MKQFIRRVLSRKSFQIPAIALLLYTVLGFLVAPSAVRWYVPKFCADRFKCTAQIGKVAVNPFLLTFEADGFSLNGPEGALLAGFDKLFLDFRASALFRRTVKFGEFLLQKPRINLVIEPDGSVNLVNLAFQPSGQPAPDESKSSSADPVRLLLDNFSLAGGEIAITDSRQVSPATVHIQDVSVELKALSTLLNRNGSYSLSARTGDGETLQWQGEIGLVPFRSKGKITCSGIQAKTLWGFLQNKVNIESPTGIVNLETDYTIDSSAPALQVVLGNLSVDIADLGFKLPGAEDIFFGLNKLDLQSAKLDLAARTVEVGKIVLDGGKVRLQIDEAGRIDVEQAVQPSVKELKERESAPVSANEQPPGEEGAPWTVDVASLEIKDVAFALDDHTRAAPLSAAVAGISVKSRVKVEAGRTPVVRLQETAAELKGLRLGRKGSPNAIFDARQLVFEDCGMDLAERTVTVSRIGLNEGHLDAGLDRDGRISLERLFAPRSEVRGASVDKPVPARGLGWRFLVKALEVANFRSAISDDGVAKTPLYNIKGLNARLTNIDGKSPMGIDLGFGVEQGGRVTVKGKVDPAAQSVEAKVNMAGLVLTPLHPYLAHYITLNLQTASVSTDGTFRFGASKITPKLAYEGNLSVEKLSLAQPASKETYLGWGAMHLSRLKLAMEPNSLNIDEIKLSKPVGELIIARDKTVNLAKILKEQPAPKTRMPEPSARGRKGGGASFPFSIGTVRIDGGDLVFSDLSMLPKFHSRIHDLKGTITRLSSEKDVVSKIQLDGGVDRYGRAKVGGTLYISDYKRSSELDVVFQNVEMASITPYSGRFAGREIKSGKLSTDLKYQVRDGKLEGNNKIIVDNLVLGEHVNSPDAVNLPLDLAVALLSDSEGRIDIGLPVSGDLSDPHFSVGPLIWKAFTSLIAKAVTAPFRALGGLFGGGAQKADAVLFEPGMAELSPPEKEKLKKIAESLKVKPQLVLVVHGRYSAEVDGAELQKLYVRRAVAGRLGIKLDAGNEPGLPDFSDSKVRHALEKIFAERLGGKALDEISQAVKKGEVKPRENSAEAAERRKAKKGGIISRTFSAVKVYKVVPGLKSPEESELLAGELFYRLAENEPFPEKDLMQLAAKRGEAVQTEVEQAHLIEADRTRTANPEPVSGEEGVSAGLSLEAKAMSENKSETIP